MTKTPMMLALLATVLAGCSSASGPTFDAYTVALPSQQTAYRVRCDGLFEGQDTCDAKAREICGGAPLRLLEGQAAYSANAGRRLLTFQCDVPMQPAPAAQPVPAVVAPVAPAALSTAPRSYALAGDASFDTDKATLTPAARSKLDKLIALARGTAFRAVTVDGYTDSRASDAHNLRLSQRRAQTVAAYLRDHGFDSQQYIIHGYGKANPVATNATEEGRAQNRRVEIQLDTLN